MKTLAQEYKLWKKNLENQLIEVSAKSSKYKEIMKSCYYEDRTKNVIQFLILQRRCFFQIYQSNRFRFTLKLILSCS